MSSDDREATRILAFSGSLRQASFNTGLLRAAQRIAPDGVDVEIFDLRGIPLFDQDVEDAGDPDRVVELRRAIADADALLIACPEYNGGVTGALKNAIDWASRPPGKSVLPGKPTAIVGATPGAGGTRFAQMMLRHTLGVLSVPTLPSPSFYLAQAHEKFTDGELDDEKTEQFLARVLAALVDWAARVGAD
jgi:chromate reductase